MNAIVKLAYQKTRQRTQVHVEAEIAETKAALKTVMRGSYGEELLEDRLTNLKRELHVFKRGLV